VSSREGQVTFFSSIRASFRNVVILSNMNWGLLKGPQALYSNISNDRLLVVQCQGRVHMYKWRLRFKDWLEKVELFLRADYAMTARLFIHPSPTPCTFCKKPSTFCLRGIDKQGKVQHLHCCGRCKREIEANSIWVVNNLEIVHGLTQWKILFLPR
jgi:hypothetical protein